MNDDQEKIHIGTDIATGLPVWLPLALFCRHCHIRGMTGARKTVWMTYIMLQIISLGYPVLTVDYGGDLFCFNAVRRLIDSLKSKPPFRFLSTPHDDAWHCFEPLQACWPLSREKAVQIANYLMASLSLDYGEGWAKAYFSKINYAVFLREVVQFVERGVLTPALREFAEAVAAARKTNLRDEAEARLTLEQLLPYQQLSYVDDPDRRIEALAAIKESAVTYGFLPSLLEPPARAIGAMLLWSYVMAAMTLRQTGKPFKQVFVFIDEFAAVAAAKAFSDLLSLARKYKISLVLVNQSSSQLVSRDRDLRHLVFENTAVRLYLTSLGDDIDVLRGCSLDVLKPGPGGMTIQGLSQTTQFREVFEPELTRNDVLMTSHLDGEGYLMYTSRGHIEPIRVRFEPCLFKDIFTPEAHSELSGIPIPKRAEPLASDSDAKQLTARSERGRLRPPKDDESRRREEVLTRLLEAKKAAERWEDK